MSEKPEALRLADKLSSYKLSSGYASYCHKAAAELRRQHAENERLRELLTEAREDVEWLGHTVLVDRIDAALRREDV